MNAADVINEARDHHGAFSPIRHGDTLCARALSRAVERFYRSVVMMGCEDVLAEDVVFDEDDIAEALTGTPLDLPAYLKITGALVSSDQGIYSVTILENEAVTLVDGSVEFARNGTDPQPGDALRNVYA